MSDNLILVLGSTGTVGRRLVDRLTRDGHAVRAASRQADPPFDWSDPQSWDANLDGATSVFLMAPDGVAVDPEFVHRAGDKGTRKIVLLSSRGLEAMGDDRLLRAEQDLGKSGAEWTILRCDWFNQNFDEGFFRPAVDGGELALPVGAARMSFVDADDIAAVAAVALTTDGHAGATYEVTGPAALTFAEALDTIAGIVGHPVRFGGGPDDYRRQQAAFGAPEEQTEAEIAVFGGLREAGDWLPTDTVHRLTGRAPISFATYAEAAFRPR